MKVSFQAVQFVSNDTRLLEAGTEEIVQKIGAQLGAVEEVIDFGRRYDGIVLVKVVSCQKHDNADKLSVCRIDDGGVVRGVERGDDGLVQVVCGAPNVREGLHVAWITPGSIVPATYDKDPFTIETREIRGVVSNGMLASASELAINDDHSGLLEVDIKGISEPLAKPGTEFKKLYGLDDVVIDIENKMFTHRPDCFGILGVAREIAGIQGLAFESPDWYLKVPKILLDSSEHASKRELDLEVNNEVPDLVPRFMAVAMKDIVIKPSPIWLQALLSRIGVKPINNVVDLTNYIAYLTAQPLHAYDYDKVAALSEGKPKIVIRHPKQGEKIALLNGKTIEPRAEAIMITTDKELIGIGGVMGGTSTEVDDNTKSIILECANFDMYSIRKTSMEHGLFTDAVARFSKGQSVLQNDRVIVEIMKYIEQQAGGQQASDVIDSRTIDESVYSRQTINLGVKASIELINSRLGLKLSKDEIITLVRNVGFACLEEGDRGEIEFHAPFWRTDIAIPEDVVEEVGRLYGYERLSAVLPSKKINPAIVDPMLRLKSRLRASLSSMGANEVYSYSFVNEKLIRDASQDTALAFRLTNALSPELQYYRLSITPSLLARVHQNIKAGHHQFALFEIGKVHGKSEIDEHELPREFGRAALVVASGANKSSAYYLARRYLEQLGEFEFVPFDQALIGDHKLMNAMMAPFEPARSAIAVNSQNMPIGVVGEYKIGVVKAFKLPVFCAGFEIFLSALKETGQNNYLPLSLYPSVEQDICFEVPYGMAYKVLFTGLAEAVNELRQDWVIDQRLIDIFAGGNQPDTKRITFRITVNSYSRTLTESAVTEFTDKLAQNVESRLEAKRI